jgi:hypothetical protein
MQHWHTAADIDLATSTLTLLMYFCSSKHPAPKQLLPKLVALLQCCYVSGEKLNRWYFDLQEAIQNYYSTEGNCLFFGDAKEILSGEVAYGMEEINLFKKLRGLNLK